MATYNLTAGQQGKHDFTLTADTVDTVTFPDDVGMVQIVTDGAEKVYYTTDGSEPSVGGANSLMIPGGGMVWVVDREPVEVEDQGRRTIVKLISAGTPVCTVQRGQ